MNDLSWFAQNADKKINKAWHEIERTLGDLFDEKLSERVDQFRFDVRTPQGKTLWVEVSHRGMNDGDIQIECESDEGFTPVVTTNPYEGAHLVIETLRGHLQVIHPAFVHSEDHPDLFGKLEIPDNPPLNTAPSLGKAQDKEMLGRWVTSTIEEIESLTVDPPAEDKVCGHTDGDLKFEIHCISEEILEIHVAIVEDVSKKDFRKWVNRPMIGKFPFAFYMEGGVLWMKMFQSVNPFVKENFKSALDFTTTGAKLASQVFKSLETESSGEGTEPEESPSDGEDAEEMDKDPHAGEHEPQDLAPEQVKSLTEMVAELTAKVEELRQQLADEGFPSRDGEPE